jgi:hypothetical protein
VKLIKAFYFNKRERKKILKKPLETDFLIVLETKETPREEKIEP